jgi:beta-galactosidase/beta-glucuronidase
LLQRDNWVHLNGNWDFAMDAEGEWSLPEQVRFDRTIEVPFAPETPASGVEETGFYQAVWYRRKMKTPALQRGRGERLILHFGAVDYLAGVWVNGRLAIRHEGGYTPFKVDITDYLVGAGDQTVVVCAQDDPHDLAKPRGKQDWQLRPHSIWYMRTTGIWQTVWLEVVPESWIESVRLTANVEEWEIVLDARIAGRQREDLRLHVKLEAHGKTIADDSYAVAGSEVQRRIALDGRRLWDAQAELLWSPEAPNIIDVRLELRDGDGNVIDKASSYAAMRGVKIEGNRFLLNGKVYPLQLVLDQGYWPESGLTAPDDGALRRDVELVKAAGFNGVRKHQKIEDPRFLYWADHLGLLVWEEMPGAYRFGREMVRRVSQQWVEVIERDAGHPCIVAWVPFNESWGVGDLATDAAQRDAVDGVYHLTRALDPTRPVIGNDGWEFGATDIIGIHDYDGDAERLAGRYSVDAEGLAKLLGNERPGSKMLLLAGYEYRGQPIVLSEFGGIAFSKDVAATWGYSRAASSAEFARRYARLLQAVRSIPLLAGFCYTQFTDTYQEANGLFYMDRRPKFALAQMAIATHGARDEAERKIEEKWRTIARNSRTKS